MSFLLQKQELALHASWQPSFIFLNPQHLLSLTLLNTCPSTLFWSMLSLPILVVYCPSHSYPSLFSPCCFSYLLLPSPPQSIIFLARSTTHQSNPPFSQQCSSHPFHHLPTLPFCICFTLINHANSYRNIFFPFSMPLSSRNVFKSAPPQPFNIYSNGIYL